MKLKIISASIFLLIAGGCSTFPGDFFGFNNTSEEIEVEPPVVVIDVGKGIIKRMYAQKSFADVFHDIPAFSVLMQGDVLEITLVENRMKVVLDEEKTVTKGRRSKGSKKENADEKKPKVEWERVESKFPPQTVSRDGTIKVPYIGLINIEGKTVKEVEESLTSSLQDKFENPQVSVVVSQYAPREASIVGKVNKNAVIPLTEKGERLMDALAYAGGPSEPIENLTVRITRGDKSVVMPLKGVTEDTRENISLQHGDVVTVQAQPVVISVLGKRGELRFDAVHVTLSDVMTKIDEKATQAFVFRFEEPDMIKEFDTRFIKTPDGKVPVVYRLALNGERGALLASSFVIKNKDVVYVTKSTEDETRKFIREVIQPIPPRGDSYKGKPATVVVF